MEMPFDLKVAEASVSRGKIGPAVLHFNKLLRETPSAYNRAFLLFKQGLLFKSYLCLDLAAMCFEQIVREFDAQDSDPGVRKLISAASSEASMCRSVKGSSVVGAAFLPTSLTQEVSSRCNYFCRKCLHKDMKRAKRDLDPEQYGRFLERWSLLFGEFEKITFAGGGEVLLHQEIVKIIQITRAHMPHSEMSLLTNGERIKKDTAKALIESGLVHWEVSLDTVDPQEYARLMGKDSLPLVLENLKILWDLLERDKRGTLVVRAHAVADDRYHENMQKILKTLDDLGLACDFSHAPLLTLMKRNNEEGLDLWEKTLDWHAKPEVCANLWESITVVADGSVRRCCSDIFDCPEEETLGNVFEDNLYHVVFHKKRFDVQKLMAEGKVDELYLCRACEELYRGTSTWNENSMFQRKNQ